MKATDVEKAMSELEKFAEACHAAVRCGLPIDLLRAGLETAHLHQAWYDGAMAEVELCERKGL